MYLNDKIPLGVCSWSLKNDRQALKQLRELSGICHVHLDINAILDRNDRSLLEILISDAWEITATMIAFLQEDYSSLDSIKQTGGIVPDFCWEANKERVCRAVELTKELGLQFLEFHFGFLDLESKKAYDTFSSRVNTLADYALQHKIVLLMETGQESADHLREFLETMNHPALAVNFDPGNMILYDKGNPLEALDILLPWIRHIHGKDAIPSERKGEWGTEMPWGNGALGVQNFLKKLSQANYCGALCFEREAGNTRLEDIATAVRAC